MKFQLAINLERLDLDVDVQKVESHTLDMVQMADRGGFSTVWAAEHHALEMTIAPNPFQILTWWAAHTERIRLGSAVAVAAYWHPINLAGEAAFTDLISGGRLDFGIGSGAYQREFDRMHPGLKQSDAYTYMHEMLPVLKRLWAGDYAHDGELWKFPTSTSCPKPLQQPHPPVWVAARSPITFDWAVKNECNIMSWPIARPHAEMVKYRQQFDDSIAANPGMRTPEWAMMRHAAVYEDESDWMVPVEAAQRQLGMFTTLFAGDGGVTDGVPAETAKDVLEEHVDYNMQSLHENLLFGTPSQVVEKLRTYEALGVDHFIYYASMGLGMPEQKRSLELFIDEVMPAFA